MRAIQENHLFDPKKIEVLEREDRKIWQNPYEIIEKVGIKPDFIAADIGAGSGVFTIPLARKVKKVYAIDVQKEMLEFLENKIKKFQLANVDSKLAAKNEIPLADESVNFLISVNTLHEFDDKDQMVKEMFRVLKPNGNALISDFQKKETDFGPPVFIRLSKNDAISLFERNGFTTLQTHQLMYHYLLVFSK